MVNSMETDMKDIEKIINMKENEYIIIIMEIDMKEIGKIINIKGIFYFNNGNRYEGDFKDGKAEGKGIYYYNNGSRYEGDLKNWLK